MHIDETVAPNMPMLSPKPFLDLQTMLRSNIYRLVPIVDVSLVYINYNKDEGKPKVTKYPRQSQRSLVKTSMFISTDFKKKYKEKAIGQSKALDACAIVKEAQTPLGCLYYNANVNAVYIVFFFPFFRNRQIGRYIHRCKFVWESCIILF